MTQLSLIEPAHDDVPPRGHGKYERYGPWPAPDGFYSHYVVWRTVITWNLHDWLHARDRQI